LLFGDQKIIIETLEKYIGFGSREQKWIFNLGHGFLPGIPYENAKLVVDWIKQTNWRRG
jgi:uroporphyrinogen decarboxylase